jgi:hypothetical protein
MFVCPPTYLDVQFGYTDRNHRYVVAQFLIFYKCCRETFLQAQTESINYEVISITYYECVSVALVMQRGQRMRHIRPAFSSAAFSSAACPVLPHFSKLYHKQHNSRKKKSIENKMRVLIFSKTMFDTFLILDEFSDIS